MIERPYAAMKYVELKAEAKRRGLPLRGSKDDLVHRLFANDKGEVYRPSRDASKPEDKIVTTTGNNAFTICGGCRQWERRCICKDGQITKKPGPSGIGPSSKASAKTTGPGENNRDGRYIHRGTFA